jgi:hypothetical protein
MGTEEETVAAVVEVAKLLAAGRLWPRRRSGGLMTGPVKA